jgi:hypothetical protein
MEFDREVVWNSGLQPGAREPPGIREYMEYVKFAKHIFEHIICMSLI